MFKLEKNQFAENGKCWYSDEFGNKIFIIRKDDDKFVIKVRPVDKNITFNPISTSAFDEGISVKPLLNDKILTGSDEYNEKVATVEYLVNEAFTLAGHWSSMIQMILFLQVDQNTSCEIVQKNYGISITPDKIDEYKYNLLLKYEELEVFVRKVFDIYDKTSK